MPGEWPVATYTPLNVPRWAGYAVGAASLLVAAVILARNPVSGDYVGAALIAVMGVGGAAWARRNRVTLHADHLTSTNLRSHSIAYRDIRSVELRPMRYRTAVLTLNSGREVTLPQVVGKDAERLVADLQRRIS